MSQNPQNPPQRSKRPQRSGKEKQAAAAPLPSEGLLSTQLSEVNQRVRMHAGRLWQLPFAYLGVLAVFLASSDRDLSGVEARWTYLVFFLLGLIVIWCMRGAYEGIERGVETIREIERKTGLAPSVERNRTRYTYHFVPYFLLAILGVVVSGGLLVLNLFAR